MSSDDYSRRRFLADSGGALGAAWIATHFPAIAGAVGEAGEVANGAKETSLLFLSDDDAALIDAISARLIPGDEDDPGAREAHVTVFVDRILVGLFENRSEAILSDLNQFDADFAAEYGKSFAGANQAEQDEFLATQSGTVFFFRINLLTHLGMFALPSYGGNFEKVGWELMGFEDRHMFQPPFGYYDRDYPGFEAVAARYKGKT